MSATAAGHLRAVALFPNHERPLGFDVTVELLRVVLDHDCERLAAIARFQVRWYLPRVPARPISPEWRGAFRHHFTLTILDHHGRVKAFARLVGAGPIAGRVRLFDLLIGVVHVSDHHIEGGDVKNRFHLHLVAWFEFGVFAGKREQDVRFVGKVEYEGLILGIWIAYCRWRVESRGLPSE